MKTFVIGNPRTIRVLGENVEVITSAQARLAVCLLKSGLSLSDCHDLLDRANNFPINVVERLPKKAPTPVVDFDYHRDAESMTWQQIANLGSKYKISAIKRLREVDPAYSGLKDAKDRVEQYMADEGIL